ncbi:hypothetical protein H0X10_01610 [Candidatus Saccharibacteria bacterium]|nr:hypothetical protein [Candidatus Saccharibacteria bacterium]
MIQFNLLPDIKLEYIRSKRTKHAVMIISSVIAAASLALFVLLFLAVNVLQRNHLNNLNKDIKQDSDQLQSIESIDRILTVQNQLNKLTELHDAKPVASRLKTYIPQVTPAQVSFAKIEVDFQTSAIKFTGSADAFRTINQFVDTLKFTKYQSETSEEQLNAFSEVVLTSFGKDDKGSSYVIDLKFDPIIFSSQSEVKLVVPNIITTRSATERPDEGLLSPLRNTQEEGGQ